MLQEEVTATVPSAEGSPAAMAAISKRFTTRQCNEMAEYGTMYASKLIKMSARQYAFLAGRSAQFAPTIAMGIGSAVGDWAMGALSKEVGGISGFGKYKIAWSHDGFLSAAGRNIFYEHKWLFREGYDDWKLRSAASQCMFYAALSTLTADKLVSSKFTGRNEEIPLDRGNAPYMCVMITTTDSILSYERTLLHEELERSLAFYRRKADSIHLCLSSGNWDGVNAHDAEWKGREQDYMFPELTLADFSLVARDEQKTNKYKGNGDETK